MKMSDSLDEFTDIKNEYVKVVKEQINALINSSIQNIPSKAPKAKK